MTKIKDFLKEQEKKEDTNPVLPTSKLTNILTAIIFGDKDVSNKDADARNGELFCVCHVAENEGFIVRIFNERISALYKLLQPELFGEMEIDKVYNLEKSIRKEVNRKEVKNSDMWFILVLTNMPYYENLEEIVEPISLKRNGKIIRIGYERIKEEE